MPDQEDIKRQEEAAALLSQKAKAPRKGASQKPEALEKELDLVYKNYLDEKDPALKQLYRNEALDLARRLKEVASKEDSQEHRQRFYAAAERVERGEPKENKALATRVEKIMRKERMDQMATRAEVQNKMATGLQGGRPMVSPEERARFHRLFVNPPPKAKEEPKKPEGPTASQQVAAALGRRARVRQIERASQPAPRRSVKRPKLHVKKSGVPKLTKGKNVKLQVPSGKLPHTQQLRSVLKRGGAR